MTKNLQLTNDAIIYKRRKVGQMYLPAITKSFKIKFDAIQIIAISPRLAFDDEMLMVTIIDRNRKFYKFSSREFCGDALTQIELRLGLKSIRLTEWEKFSWEEQLYWKDLFIPPEKLEKRLIQGLKFLALKKSISGDFNPKVAAYLDKN
jgi:hypothetical protein